MYLSLKNSMESYIIVYDVDVHEELQKLVLFESHKYLHNFVFIRTNLQAMQCSRPTFFLLPNITWRGYLNKKIIICSIYTIKLIFNYCNIILELDIRNFTFTKILGSEKLILSLLFSSALWQVTCRNWFVTSYNLSQKIESVIYHTSGAFKKWMSPNACKIKHTVEKIKEV